MQLEDPICKREELKQHSNNGIPSASNTNFYLSMEKMSSFRVETFKVKRTQTGPAACGPFCIAEFVFQ